jgi:hypothetical protein
MIKTTYGLTVDYMRLGFKNVGAPAKPIEHFPDPDIVLTRHTPYAIMKVLSLKLPRSAYE